MTEPNYTLGYSVLAFTKKFLQSLYIYIYLYVYKFSFPLLFRVIFLIYDRKYSMKVKRLMEKHVGIFQMIFANIHTYKVNIPMFHPAYSDFLNSICPWEKCRTIHRFSYRKNVKLFATGEGEMFRDVSNKKISV
jgi:hypothetical protein